jgi:Caspase domain
MLPLMKSLFLLFLGLTSAACLAADKPRRVPKWSPENTRVVVISLARFAGEKDGATSFSLSDRLDDPLVELFKERGVPEEQILYLKDEDATQADITARFPAFLAESSEDEMLIFYYSSHGGYDPKTGAHTFSAFDGSMPIGWFVGKIEARFEGTQAMLFSDCCFSGGLVELASVRTKTPISWGALSTTGSCNLGYSGWRFTDVLLRAWSGDVAMDFDESGTISFDELCVFAERYMAFVAEGKPLYASTGRFNGELVLSKTDRPAKDGIGDLVEAREGKSWFKAEVIDVQFDGNGEAKRLRVHFTDKSRYSKRAWLSPDDIREYEYRTYKLGTRVEIRNADGEWLPGKVIDAFEHMHECSYDGKSAFYNEWMSPSRIRSRR